MLLGHRHRELTLSVASRCGSPDGVGKPLKSKLWDFGAQMCENHRVLSLPLIFLRRSSHDFGPIVTPSRVSFVLQGKGVLVKGHAMGLWALSHVGFALKGSGHLDFKLRL